MKFSPLFALSALIALTPVAFAQSTTDLTVTGTITPAACTPSLSGGGSFEFGRISAQDLKQDAQTMFKSSLRQMSVVCDAPTRFALRAVDGRAGTDISPNEESFGVGLNGTEKIGRYLLRTNNYTADGNSSTTLLESWNGGSAWSLYGSTYAHIPNTNFPWLVGVSVDGGMEPSAIGMLTADFQIYMHIAPAKDLTLTDAVPIDGASTLEVVYL
ncbi:DUF1120 domain-containing protein [Pseudomonas sp. LS1212]|uniref:DUF1120 domain-containing protein n=1 Tax=Pseudomonas sp. LS1212 TaxID=2972478 RepID=UPI00215C21A8|nr:DUF1120 domain-containing protein [Pseudomonas sp. LS1212]UVJ45132.1 DUF1120 domain-containing protein [Pseudomonas sp. LS1212]